MKPYKSVCLVQLKFIKRAYIVGRKLGTAVKLYIYNCFTIVYLCKHFETIIGLLVKRSVCI